MNLHQILSTVPKEWHSVAAHYVKVLSNAGVPFEKIDGLVQWGCSYQGPGDEEALLSSFQRKASSLGLESHVTSLAADMGLDAREQINSGKWQPEPVQPDENSRLLQDIRAFRQQWPDAFAQDREMQAAELRLIDIQLGNTPAPAVEAKPEPGKFAVPRGSRMDEIRQIMRDDPDRYNSDRALQNEQLSLIEAQLASRSAEVSNGSTPATPAPAVPGNTGESN